MNSQRGLVTGMVMSGLVAGAEVRFRAEGRSMLPLVRPGDEVVLSGAGTMRPKAGDVVAVQGMPEGGLLLHRVVRRRGDILIVRGDNTTVGNGEFAVGDVLGVVSAIEREGRSVWFGAGRLGWLVALAVRTGLVWRLNRVCRGLGRVARRCLKFRGADSRLPEHKGDDGNK